jgi:hypothetical protein
MSRAAVEARQTLCGNARIARWALRNTHELLITRMTLVQREHSANVKEAPKSYPQSEPAKKVNIMEFDCRGLEFVEFKADVSHSLARVQSVWG